MRELTNDEQKLAEIKVDDYLNSNNVDKRPYGIFIDGYIAGLETQDSRIALLESRIAELESVLKLMELEID